MCSSDLQHVPGHDPVQVDDVRPPAGRDVVVDPHHLIFLSDTVCCHQSAATVAARPGWGGIAAVTHHQVVGVNDDIASRWGPRIVDLYRIVARHVLEAERAR